MDATIPDLIAQAAAAAGVPSDLAIRVASAESGLNQDAVSPKGAIGIFQLMPATAAALGVDPTQMLDNIRGGVAYLKQMLDQFGDTAEALAAYNWGPGNLSRTLSQWGDAWFGHVPAETQNYVQGIVGAVGNAIDTVGTAVTDLPPGIDQTTLLIGGAIIIAIVLFW